ncbi:L-fuculokinase [Enterobacteriaceae bacterium RIT691]|nr:L-fuculokinase [Enterobacteriaceae bacterium RIT691]
MKDCFLVLDCGATNVRAMALDPQGTVVARASIANASEPATEDASWHQWSLDAILQRFAQCCREVQTQLTGYRIAGLTVTTFGVDGALVDNTGELLYPIISWKCPRTTPVMNTFLQQVSAEWLQKTSGVGHFSFNTLYKLFWLKQHHPDLLAKAHRWLFISSLINQRLTGEFTTDRTMAGTSQLLSLQSGDFSASILDVVGVPESLFPPQVMPGECVGQLLPAMAAFLGLPPALPVISCGHDTQFALYGAGADIDQPVLSSGTWEILMVRSRKIDSQKLVACPGSTCELDSEPGVYNPGMQYLASGVLEWLRTLLGDAQTPWQDIVEQAGRIPAGCEGVRMNCELLTHPQAGWEGVSLGTTRGHLYRAALEGLTRQLKDNLARLEQVAGFKTRELLLVGGGSRNTLWNQMKADALGIPVKVLDEAETTVLGASFYGWSGVGFYPTASAARAAVDYRYRVYTPQEN